MRQMSRWEISLHHFKQHGELPAWLLHTETMSESFTQTQHCSPFQDSSWELPTKISGSFTEICSWTSYLSESAFYLSKSAFLIFFFFPFSPTFLQAFNSCINSFIPGKANAATVGCWVLDSYNSGRKNEVHFSLMAHMCSVNQICEGFKTFCFKVQPHDCKPSCQELHKGPDLRL